MAMRLEDDTYEREARYYLAMHGFEELKLNESECRNIPGDLVYLLPGHIRFTYYGMRVLKPDIAVLRMPTVMLKKGEKDATIYVTETRYLALSDNNMKPLLVKRTMKSNPRAQQSPLRHLFIEKEEGLSERLFGNVPECFNDPGSMA